MLLLSFSFLFVFVLLVLEAFIKDLINLFKEKTKIVIGSSVYVVGLIN